MPSRSFVLFLTALLTLLILPSSAISIKCSNPNQTELSYRGDGTGLPDVYKKLSSCPNITSLELDMSWTGCVINGEPWHFDFRNGDRFPNLTKLSLSDYDLAGKDTGYIMPSWSWEYWAKQKAVGALRFTKLLPSIVTAWDETNLEKWLRVMDFSHLEELYLDEDDSTFYDRMKHELPNLQRLAMTWGATGNVTAPADRVEFVNSVPPLRELLVFIGAPYLYGDPEVPRMDFPLSAILDRYCPTLESLALKQSETEVANKRRPMLSIENITTIGHACPKLANLELDIDRNASTVWPLETFKALTDIGSLTNLTLRLEIGADLHPRDMYGELDWNSEGITRGGPFREPRMNATAAEALFSHLRGQKKGEGLRAVNFEIGDYIDKPYMGPIAFGSWASGRARKFMCEAVKEGEKEEGSKFGNCHILGDEDPFPWDDEAGGLGQVTEMWSQRDDAAVEAYLAWMRGERRET